MDKHASKIIIEKLSDILFFSGTFNPVHLGHITIAQDVKKKLGCKKIIFVPAKNPYHKSVKDNVDFHHRMKMLELALKVHENCEVSDIDDRANKGNSYSLNTVTAFIKEISKNITLKENEKLYFLIGADAFKELSSWYKIDELIKKVKFIVVSRPNEDFPEISAQKIKKLYPDLDYEIIEEDYNISSSKIRENILQNIKTDFIPEIVEEYIKTNNLYKAF